MFGESKIFEITTNPFDLSLRHGQEFVKNPLREDIWSLLNEENRNNFENQIGQGEAFFDDSDD